MVAQLSLAKTVFISMSELIGHKSTDILNIYLEINTFFKNKTLQDPDGSSSSSYQAYFVVYSKST